MVNTRNKGNRNETKAVKILENAGYSVIKKVHTRYSPGDFFGMFDVIGVSAIGIRFVQCKTNRRETPEEREAIQLFQVPMNATKEVWVFHDRGKTIIHIIK